jgi:hypothetical protein
MSVVAVEPAPVMLPAAGRFPERLAEYVHSARSARVNG